MGAFESVGVQSWSSYACRVFVNIDDDGFLMILLEDDDNVNRREIAALRTDLVVYLPVVFGALQHNYSVGLVSISVSSTVIL